MSKKETCINRVDTQIWCRFQGVRIQVSIVNSPNQKHSNKISIAVEGNDGNIYGPARDLIVKAFEQSEIYQDCLVILKPIAAVKTISF